MDNTNLQRARNARSFVALGTFLLVAALLLRGIVVGGVPTYRHDWNWPLDPTQFAGVTPFALSSWIPVDLGQPNLYPSSLVLLLVERVLLDVFGSHVALVVLLVLLYVGAAMGTMFLASGLGFNGVSAWVAGATYECSAAMHDQLVAGHLGDLCMCAALPWLLYGLLAPTRSRRLGVVAGLGAVGVCIQIQGLPIVMLATAVVLLVVRSRGTLTRGLIAASTALLVSLPSISGLLSSERSSTTYILQEHAVLMWEKVQSVALSAAWSGRGYFARYDAVSSTLTVDVLAACSILAVVTLLYVALRSNDRRLTALVVLFAIGVLTIAGLNGPASGALAWAFVHVESASTFRELFHAAPLVALPLSVAALSLVRATGNLGGPVRALVAVATASVLVMLSKPGLVGTDAWLSHRTLTLSEKRFLSVLQAVPEMSRFAIYPGRQPYVYGGAIGVDALGYYMVGSQWPVFEYFPSGILARASSAWLNGDPNAHYWYDRTGVSYIYDRERPLPAYVSPRRLQVDLGRTERDVMGGKLTGAMPIIRLSTIPLLIGGGFERLPFVPANRVVAFMRQQPAFLESTNAFETSAAAPEDIALAAGCARFVPAIPSRITADIRSGWVSAWRYGDRWPHLDDALSSAIATTSDAPVPDAFKTSDRLLAMTEPWKSYRWMTPSQFRKSRGRVAAVAGGMVFSRRGCMIRGSSKPSRAPTLLSFHRNSITDIAGSFRSWGSAGALVLADAYDQGWQLNVDGAPVVASMHFESDGFGNGWIIKAKLGHHTFEATYARQRFFQVTTLCALLVWGILIVALVLCKGPDDTPDRAPTHGM